MLNIFQECSVFHVYSILNHILNQDADIDNVFTLYIRGTSCLREGPTCISLLGYAFLLPLCFLSSLSLNNCLCILSDLALFLCG